MYIAVKIKNRTASSMEEAIRKIVCKFPKGVFQTFTIDRGKEFSCYWSIEQELNIPVYFADPYSSWQRGSNENANGLLRELFPKKTDLSQVEPNELERALELINLRPRKC